MKESPEDCSKKKEVFVRDSEVLGVREEMRLKRKKFRKEVELGTRDLNAEWTLNFSKKSKRRGVCTQQ